MPNLDFFRGVQNFRTEMDRLFDQFSQAAFPLTRSQSSETNQSRVLSPLTDVSDDETAYRIVAELPGIDPKNVEINVTGNTLTVRAEQQQETQQRGRNFLINERRTGTIQRQFPIPDDVDQQRIQAEFRNGLLAITLGKSQQAQQRRRIDIKSSSN